MSSEDRVSESEDRQQVEESIDLQEPPSEDREGSKWASYALAALLVVVFLVGLGRLVAPGPTGLLVGAMLALFGLAIAALAIRERLD